MREAVTYGKYLRIEELLGLQQPRDERTPVPHPERSCRLHELV